MGARIRAVVLGLLVVAGLAVAGCGSDDDGESTSTSASSSGELTNVDVGIIPIADIAPLYLGMQEGFFEERGLKVTPTPAQGGAAIVPAVLSGDFDFGFGNNVSLMIGRQEGLPLQIVTQGVIGGDSAETSFNWVMGGKGVKEPADLNGKTIAVNALNNVGEVIIRTALENEGIENADIEFIEVPFPDMPAALEAGRVDAAWNTEPFVSQMEAAGANKVLSVDFGTTPDLSIATYFTSEQFIAEHQEITDAFIAAMNESLEFAAANEEAVREIIPTFTKIPPEAAQQIKLPRWTTDLSLDSIQLTGRQAVKYGLLEEEPNMDELIYEGAGGQ